MAGLSVGLILKMPSIHANIGRKIIPNETIIPQLSFSYTVNVPDNYVVSPKFTFLEGAPRARVEFGDQTPSVAVESGVEIPHLYKTRGLYKINLVSQSQQTYLQEIDIRDDPVIITEYWLALLDFLNLTRLHNCWYVGYGEVGIAKVARGFKPNTYWIVGLGSVGSFSIER